MRARLCSSVVRSAFGRVLRGVRLVLVRARRQIARRVEDNAPYRGWMRHGLHTDISRTGYGQITGF